MLIVPWRHRGALCGPHVPKPHTAWRPSKDGGLRAGSCSWMLPRRSGLPGALVFEEADDGDERWHGKALCEAPLSVDGLAAR
jgi:hypothetical protein